MALKASDLPDDAKRELLRRMREQIGSTNYKQLVDRFGENGLLDQALEKADELDDEHERKEKEQQGFWYRYGFLIVLLILILPAAWSRNVALTTPLWGFLLGFWMGKAWSEGFLNAVAAVLAWLGQGGILVTFLLLLWLQGAISEQGGGWRGFFQGLMLGLILGLVMGVRRR